MFSTLLVLLLLAPIPALVTGQTHARVDSYVLSLGERLTESAYRQAADGPLPGDSTRTIDPAPELEIATREPYGCRLPLRKNMSRRGQQFVIDILGPPDPPNVCPMAEGPARTSAWLPVDSGRYLLRIRSRGREDQYSLLITDTLISVIPREVQFTTFRKLTRLRPPHLTFALYCTLPATDHGLDSTQAWVCTDFEQLLRDSLPVTPVELSAERQDAYTPVPARQWGPVRYFHYDSVAVFRRAYDLVQAFSQARMKANAPNADLALMNWRHLGFSSYLCRRGQGWCESVHGFPYW